MKTIEKKSEYDIQAEKFLEDTATKYSATYTGHRPYWEKDKEFRATFVITLQRKNKPPMTFNFGQSINSSYSMKGGQFGHKKVKHEQVFWNSSEVKQAIATGAEDTSCYHRGESIRLRKVTTAPSAYDVLACLTHYDPETFEDFCGNFGYDVDSRKAEKTYFAVQKEWNDLSRLYTEEELDLLREIN